MAKKKQPAQTGQEASNLSPAEAALRQALEARPASAPIAEPSPAPPAPVLENAPEPVPQPTPKQGAEHYLVSFKGDYRALTAVSGKKVKKPYEIRARLPENLFEDPNLSPTAIFRSSVAPKVMLKKYPDFIGIASCEVVGSEFENEPSRPVIDERLMNRSQLVELIDARAYKIDISLYLTASDLRFAINNYRLDPSGWEKQEEFRRRTKGQKVERERALEMTNLFVE